MGVLSLIFGLPIYMVWSVSTAQAYVTPGVHAGLTTANESANGKTLKISKGGALTITLNSTYWTFSPLANAKVLRQIGAPATVGYPPGSASAPAGCRIPGSGCGTVTWKLKAIAAGSVVITANRTSCGEAMRCTPAQSLYRLTVKVI